jgi:hypothetical protein
MAELEFASGFDAEGAGATNVIPILAVILLAI